MARAAPGEEDARYCDAEEAPNVNIAANDWAVEAMEVKVHTNKDELGGARGKFKKISLSYNGA